MWNMGPNDINLRNSRNGYGITPVEFTSVQKFPPVHGSKPFLAESSVCREFPSDIPNSNSNLDNGTLRGLTATNPQAGNHGMFLLHSHQPETGNNGWTQVMNGNYHDPNNYSARMQMKGMEFMPHVAGPSPGSLPPSVENHSVMPISQNFVNPLSNFTAPGNFIPYHVESTGSVEMVRPTFNLLSRNSVLPNAPQESNPSEFSFPDTNITNGNVLYVPPIISEANQVHASYYYPKVAAYSNPPDSKENNPGVSEVSSETYKKACDALLAYAQMKRIANEPVTLNGSGNESTKAEARSQEKEPSLTMDKQSFTGTSEVLWDGTLQLNAATEVSAIALFKSGEKVVDSSWAKFVDIKGKVKLEAFEKFLQELPRSRNRSLMVISIYWKAGTSESGLKGMKEVAKGYKEQQRVGYAQFSSGVDLYVCPRSDAVITILAKYGFLRGMGAIEDDQDSLIGCVVWRRVKPIAEPIAEPIDQPSTEPIDATAPSASAVNSNPSLSTPALDISISSLLPQLQPLTSQVELPQSTDELHQLLSSAVKLLMQGAPENMKPPSPVNVDQKVDSRPSEEDLPEFDFCAATGGPPLSQVSGLKQAAEAHQRSSGVGPMGHFSTSEPEKPQMHGLRPYFEEDNDDNDNDDDDDMPEWCPPGMERQKMALLPQQPPQLSPQPPLSKSGSTMPLSLPQSLPLDQNEGVGKQDQRGILGQCPVDLYPKISPFPRPEARRSGQSGHRSPPEMTPRSRSKKQGRSSGWDIRPSEGKSSRSRWR